MRHCVRYMDVSKAETTLHVYTRVSTTTQEDHGTSLETQAILGERKAEELGFDFRLWNEGGKSSNHEDISERPVLADLVAAIERGEVRHLFVYENSRLSRDDHAASVLRHKFRKHNVRLYTKDGVYDLNEPTDAFYSVIMDAVSQLDNKLRAARTRQGKLHRVKSGQWHGGPPPFGYRLEAKRLVPDETESKAVREIYQKYASGESVRAIRLYLIQQGIKPRRNGQWTDGSVQKILQNTHYKGSYSFCDHATGEVVEVPCPPIVSVAVWAEVQSTRAKIAERKGQLNRTQHFYLLRDLMYCGHCGTPMGGRINKRKNENFYYCPRKQRQWRLSGDDETKFSKKNNCGFTRSMNIERSDELVWQTVLDIHSNSSLLKEAVKQRLVGDIISPKAGYDAVLRKDAQYAKTLEQELKDVTAAIVKVETDKLLKKIADDEYPLMIESLRNHKLSLQQRLDVQHTSIAERSAERRWVDWVKAFGDEIRLQDAKTLEEKRDYLKGMIDRIDVKYLEATREHELSIRFAMPIVGDGITKHDKGYSLREGSDVTTAKLKGGGTAKRATPVGNVSNTVE